jgi:hypothetical protein
VFNRRPRKMKRDELETTQETPFLMPQKKGRGKTQCCAGKKIRKIGASMLASERTTSSHLQQQENMRVCRHPSIHTSLLATGQRGQYRPTCRLVCMRVTYLARAAGAGAVHEREASSQSLRMTFVVPAPAPSSMMNFFATRSLLLLSLSSR